MGPDPDELDVRRLSRAAGMAVARVTGVAENRTRFARCTEDEALATIGVYVGPLTVRDRRLTLSHAAAQYLDGAHEYQRNSVDLLALAGADLALARRIAEARHDEGPSFLDRVYRQANEQTRSED